MTTKYSIITFLGFVSLIIGYFLRATQTGGAEYLQGFGGGLILAGSGMLLLQYMHDKKSKETSNKIS